MQPIAIELKIYLPTVASPQTYRYRVVVRLALEPESAREDWPPHMDVEAQIAVACRIVKVEAAIA
jgi:hypothetical protein